MNALIALTLPVLLLYAPDEESPRREQQPARLADDAQERSVAEAEAASTNESTLAALNKGLSGARCVMDTVRSVFVATKGVITTTAGFVGDTVDDGIDLAIDGSTSGTNDVTNAELKQTKEEVKGLFRSATDFVHDVPVGAFAK